jgi:uncharacterized protein DUF1629
VVPSAPNYYRVEFDDTIADAWLLDEPWSESGSIDADEFVEGRPYEGPAPVELPIYHRGRSVEFHLAAGDMPVVSSRVGDIVQRIAHEEIERFPVSIEGTRGFEILNATIRVDCVDEKRSKFALFEADDRSDKVGHYYWFEKLVIDPKRVGGKHVFRITRYELALIVSDSVKRALEPIDQLGVVFREVG